MEPGFGVGMVAAKCAVYGRRTVEYDVGTAIVSACAAIFAGWLGTWNTGFDGNSITC
jgi:hypothetical protein